MSKRRADPISIANRACSNGWQSGQHEEIDKQRRLNRFNKETVQRQDSVLNIFAIWSWVRTGKCDSFEECKASALRNGAPVPEIHELKEFWRFYKDQSQGQLSERPTVKTLHARAKSFKAGFWRHTGNLLNEEDTNEINTWMRRVLAQEEGSGVKDIERPKHNYKPVDLTRNLRALWTRGDIGYIHERNRIQFHLLLLLFCHSGARSGAIFKRGVPYKDIELVLQYTEGRREFIFRFVQRHVKNNKDPENKSYGTPGREHPLLLYDAVFLLLSIAIADGALDPNYFTSIIEGDGDGPLEWNDAIQDTPIFRAVDGNGNVHPTKPMTWDAFAGILGKVLMREYNYDRKSMHAIRREIGKQLDERYTETERSQHILQADRRVFGQSYVASTSSCDGFAAFMRQTPNHAAVEYFQGINQFWQPGLPTCLPAALRAELSRSPEIIEHDRKIAQAIDESARKMAKVDRQNAMKRLEKAALKQHRDEMAKRLRRERLLGAKVDPIEEPDPLNDLIPEKGRIATKMLSDTSMETPEKIAVMRDMHTLLTTDWSVFHRPGEVPQQGACPYCSQQLERVCKDCKNIPKHIHQCRRKATAKELFVPQRSLHFCYFCMEFVKSEEWDADCRSHLSALSKQCGSVTYRNNLVRPAFCLLCRQSEELSPRQRLQYWDRDSKAVDHIQNCHGWRWHCHQCDFSCSDKNMGHDHLKDAHGYKFKSAKVDKSTPLELTDDVQGNGISLKESPRESPDDSMFKFFSFPSSPELGCPADSATSNSPPFSCVSPYLAEDRVKPEDPDLLSPPPENRVKLEDLKVWSKAPDSRHGPPFTSVAYIDLTTNDTQPTGTDGLARHDPAGQHDAPSSSYAAPTLVTCEEQAPEPDFIQQRRIRINLKRTSSHQRDASPGKRPQLSEMRPVKRRIILRTGGQRVGS